MSDNTHEHEVRFSVKLAGDSNLQKSLLLKDFFDHCVDGGIQTSPELPETSDQFVRAALSRPAGEVLFKATLFVGEKAYLEKQGFVVTSVQPAVA